MNCLTISSELMKSQFVRPSAPSIYLSLLHGFLSKFSSCLSCAIRQDVFEYLVKKRVIEFCTIFPSFSLTWDLAVGVKIQNATPTNRSQNCFNFSRIFFSVGPHKTTFGIFEILKIFNDIF